MFKISEELKKNIKQFISTYSKNHKLAVANNATASYGCGYACAFGCQSSCLGSCTSCMHSKR